MSQSLWNLFKFTWRWYGEHKLLDTWPVSFHRMIADWEELPRQVELEAFNRLRDPRRASVWITNRLALIEAEWMLLKDSDHASVKALKIHRLEDKSALRVEVSVHSSGEPARFSTAAVLVETNCPRESGISQEEGAVLSLGQSRDAVE